MLSDPDRDLYHEVRRKPHLVAWEGRRFATAALLPPDLPPLRSALYAAGFTLDHRTQWIFALADPPTDTVTRYPGITGRTINVNPHIHNHGDGDGANIP